MGESGSRSVFLGVQGANSCRRQLHHIFKGAQTRLWRINQHCHVAGQVFVFPHLGVGLGNIGPREHFGHAGVDAPVDDKAIGLGCLFQVGKV